ncbi:MAG: hypothetical protein M3362_02820 [Acidobacteriota bacterium]|nr:hypothetical protein [Acidobacteriota bacterium]
MDESNEQDFEFISIYFGFRVRVSILSPTNNLHIRRLEARGIKQPDDPHRITKQYAEQAKFALAGADFALLKELAEEQDIRLNISMDTPEGSFKTKKIRGHHKPQFIYRRGRDKASHRKVTYEQIKGAILRFRGNYYGTLPERDQIAKKLGCSSPTIKNVLLENGERRPWREFVKAILNE